MNARYYDPETGRFISEDSYRGRGEEFWHLYLYCNSDPVNATDPSGHAAVAYRGTKRIDCGRHAMWGSILLTIFLYGTMWVDYEVRKDYSCYITRVTVNSNCLWGNKTDGGFIVKYVRIDCITIGSKLFKKLKSLSGIFITLPGSINDNKYVDCNYKITSLNTKIQFHVFYDVDSGAKRLFPKWGDTFTAKFTDLLQWYRDKYKK